MAIDTMLFFSLRKTMSFKTPFFQLQRTDMLKQNFRWGKDMRIQQEKKWEGGTQGAVFDNERCQSTWTCYFNEVSSVIIKRKKCLLFQNVRWINSLPSKRPLATLTYI